MRSRPTRVGVLRASATAATIFHRCGRRHPRYATKLVRLRARASRSSPATAVSTAFAIERAGARATITDDRQQLVVAERRGAHALRLLQPQAMRAPRQLHRTPSLLYFRPIARCCPSVSSLPHRRLLRRKEPQGASSTARAAGAELRGGGEYAGSNDRAPASAQRRPRDSYRVALTRALNASQRRAGIGAPSPRMARRERAERRRGRRRAWRRRFTNSKSSDRTPEGELETCASGAHGGSKTACQKAHSGLAERNCLEARAVGLEAVDEINGQMRAMGRHADARATKRQHWRLRQQSQQSSDWWTTSARRAQKGAGKVVRGQRAVQFSALPPSHTPNRLRTTGFRAPNRMHASARGRTGPLTLAERQRSGAWMLLACTVSSSVASWL